MTTIDRQAVLDSLSRLVTPGIKLTALADELGARKHEYAELRSILFDLVEDGTIHVLTGGAFALAPTGRPNDPHGKPQPAPEVRPQPAPRAAAAKPARRTVKGKDSGKESGKDSARDGASAREKPAARKPTLPWGARPAPAAAPAARREEYDPETGEMRPSGAAPASASVPARSSAPAAAAAAAATAAAADARPIGRITVHPAGYGFVQIEDGTTVFVPAKYRGSSLDGDRVVVDTWPGVRGTEGRVTEVLARGRARLTGILRRVSRAVYLEPDDPRIAADYGRVGVEDASMGRDGDAVVVEITRYPDAVRRVLEGRLLKVLGDPDDPRTEIEKILACGMIPLEFPDEALAQAKQTPQELGPGDFADRIDLRDRRFATIDPETARDFDDALCIEDGPHGGPRVWVAVADVSHYVRWNDALDKESTIRGVSVYLPDRVIPMLPHQLSSNICSLMPLVDRCAMVVRLDYTSGGADGADVSLAAVGYAAAVIRSKARLDYAGVAAALGGDFRGRREEYRPWTGELERLNVLAQALRKQRQARGALELELSEAKVVLDADDPRLVRDVVKSKGDPAVKQAYQLVEEFMIAANEAVGRYFRTRNQPSVWRVHAPPDPDRVAQLAELLNSYGIQIDAEAAVTPLGMKAVLDQINEKPSAQGLSFLVLRTLTQAVWDTVPIGHFGLASGDYLHFTSPIRRYPDLLVHRLLKYHLHRDGDPSGGGYSKPPPPIETLTELAHASSTHERRAMEAEREAVAMYRAYLMRDQVGQRFEGTVSAVTSFGAFVELDEPFVEGLIKLDSLGNDQFDFDDVHMRLAGRKTGIAIELGDRVTVEINNVSVVRRRIDFTLVAVTTPKRAARPRKVARDTERPARPERAAAPEARPVGIPQRRKAARETERAVRAHVERGAAPRKTAAGGKLRLGVSHRGMSEREEAAGSSRKSGTSRGGGGGGRSAKPAKKRGR